MQINISFIGIRTKGATFLRPGAASFHGRGRALSKMTGGSGTISCVGRRFRRDAAVDAVHRRRQTRFYDRGIKVACVTDGRPDISTSFGSYTNHRRSVLWPRFPKLNAEARERKSAKVVAFTLCSSSVVSDSSLTCYAEIDTCVEFSFTRGKHGLESLHSVILHWMLVHP